MKKYIIFLCIFLLLCIASIPARAYEVDFKGQMLIRQFEGFSVCQYRDVAGKQTIGWGHLVREEDGLPACILPARAKTLLAQDLVGVNYCVDKNVQAWITGDQVDALGDWIFNMGCGRLQTSTLLRQVNAQRGTEDVAHEFRRWVYAGGIKQRGLVIRRAIEAQLYSGQ